MELYNRIVSGSYVFDTELYAEYSPYTVILLAYLILLQLEPNKTWEIKMVNTIPFLQGINRLVIDTRTVSPSDLDLATKVCTAREMLEGWIRYRTSLLDEDGDEYESLEPFRWGISNALPEDEEALMDQCIAPNTNFILILEEWSLWKTNVDVDQMRFAIELLSVQILYKKFLKAVGYVLQVHKPPTCTSSSPGMKVSSFNRDTSFF